ncbi:hypothetical protein [Flavobacterium hydatis]|uniref:Uncharacterized protein n=1 Tax=Flavobacterium hydatis TaxID=991 RepID=A0A085ZCR4_FLAHY|nr:hypothetical protein [Flavobacterium hydatis]KFF02228.1 hypothetical protein IW20_25270 [Flavobacterium hydatis]OXA87737.1 hypothetical protein B0A62_22430 [Flavobacterium hydatis]
MEITYTNFNEKPLTAQQVASNDRYIKIFKENNSLRKEEYYENNILINTLNYIEFGSPHIDLLLINNESIAIIEIENIDSNYAKYHRFKYHNGIIKSKGLSVYKSNQLCMMTQDLDLQTNLPLYYTTCKYYEDQINGYEFEFNYYNTGQLASVIVSNDAKRFYEQYKSSELELIPNFEWWNQYSSYYLNAEPAVPNEIIIA